MKITIKIGEKIKSFNSDVENWHEAVKLVAKMYGKRTDVRMIKGK